MVDEDKVAAVLDAEGVFGAPFVRTIVERIGKFVAAKGGEGVMLKRGG